MTDRGAAVAETIQEDDLELAATLLTIEAELREDGWRALEQLCALAAGRDGALAERIAALPDPEFREAVRSLLRLGWIDRPREE